jgi:hypothetical protein
MKEENNKEIDKEMNSEKDKYTLPIERFYDSNENEVKSIFLPYETIDVKKNFFLLNLTYITYKINFRSFSIEIIYLLIIKILILQK